MKKILFAVFAAMMAASLVGCGGGGPSSNPGVTPQFGLAPVFTDSDRFLPADSDGTARYKVFVGEETKVNFVWIPQAPRGVSYSVLEDIEAKSRSGPSEIDGSITVTQYLPGSHRITVTAKGASGEVLAVASLVLEVSNG